MALLLMDGFDKYGGVNSNSTSVQALMQQEWTSTAASAISLVAGLSSTGNAFNMGSAGTSLTKTLPGNYARLIGGLRFSSTLAQIVGVQFLDSAANQAAISINNTGTISVRNGIYNGGTILGTSTTTITANSVHYLEFDITFSNTGAYQVWLDGVSILSGSGDTTATTNNSVSGFTFNVLSGGGWTVDDLYLFDTTGTVNNAVLLTSPRIETQFPTGDAAVQFAIGASTLGSSVSRGGIAYSGVANDLYLRPYT